MAIRFHPLTYDDLEKARENRTERIELIEGELFVTPAPAPMHQLVVLRLSAVLKVVIVDSGLGVALPAPIDVVFSQQTVLQPDFVILVGERSEMFRRGSIDGPPSMVIEVLSPSTGAVDRGRKRRIYARYEVPEYWIFDLDAQAVEMHSDPVDGHYRRLRIARDVAESVTIPSLTVNLPELFALPSRFVD